MSTIVIYQKSTCTTCRQVYRALKEAGVDFTAVNYYLEPIPIKKLKELIKKMGTPPAALLRKNELAYKQLHVDLTSLSDDEIIDYLSKYPDLLQRPIVEKGSRAILARPAERIKEIL